MAIPHCLYATDITNNRKEYIRKLEVLENNMRSWCLSAPSITNSEALRGEREWSTLSERVAMEKLCYLKKIKIMSDDRWAKQVFIVYKEWPQ